MARPAALLPQNDKAVKLSAIFPKLSLNAWIRIGIGVTLVLAFLVHEAEWVQSRFILQMELLAYDASSPASITSARKIASLSGK